MVMHEICEVQYIRTMFCVLSLKVLEKTSELRRSSVDQTLTMFLSEKGGAFTKIVIKTSSECFFYLNAYIHRVFL